MALYIISELTTYGATGYFVEYAGEVFEKMTMEGRMTVCNMSIEMGARGGMIAPDEKTFTFLKNKEFSPKNKSWDKALKFGKHYIVIKMLFLIKNLLLMAIPLNP